MRNKMFRFIILLVFINIFNQIKSQTEDPKILVMGVPQYLLVEALRIDIDLRMLEKNKWAVVSPIIFLQNNPDGVGINGDFESLRGGGLEVTFKQILSKKSNTTGIYLGYGPVYHFNQINNTGQYWVEFVKKQFEPEIGEYIANVHKIGGNCILGTQFEIYRNFLIDFYMGFGIRYSFVSTNKGEGVYYNSNWVDYGYSGILMVSGVRLGVGL